MPKTGFESATHYNPGYSSSSIRRLAVATILTAAAGGSTSERITLLVFFYASPSVREGLDACW